MSDNKERGFAVVKGYVGKGIILPTRQTKGSAGYDIASAEDVIVPAGKNAVCNTGLKAFMQAGEVLKIYARSSLSARGLTLANGVGIIDSDYCDNPDNEGHIRVILHNYSDRDALITKGERIAQGIFEKYLEAGEENTKLSSRKGGIGSTGR